MVTDSNNQILKDIGKIQVRGKASQNIIIRFFFKSPQKHKMKAERLEYRTYHKLIDNTKHQKVHKIMEKQKF